MKFKTIAEAFNYYKDHSKEQIEKRAAELKNEVETDSNADVDAINIEISGLNQAKQNSQEKTNVNTRSQFNPLGGASFETRGSVEATEGDVFSSVEYRSAFYKKLLNQPLSETEKTAYQRAQTIQDAEHRMDQFNTVTDSAAVIPTQTLNEVIKKARTLGGIMAEVRKFAMPGNIAIPVGTPSNKAQWHTEGQKVDSEKAEMTSVIFKNYEIIKIFSMSAATKSASIAAFESYLVEELVNCVMEAIADALINGTGEGQGTGVVSGITWTEDTNLLTVAAGTDFAYADVAKTVGMLKRGYSKGAKWAMNNKTLYSQFYAMVDANKRPIFVQDPKGESIGKILTYEVVIDDNLDDNTVVFGNLAYLGYNLPNGIVIEVSRESSFRSGLIDYRALAIADTKPLVSEAFVKLTQAAE